MSAPTSADTSTTPRVRAAQLTVLALLILFGTALRISNLSGISLRSPDERYSTWQANVLLDHGTVDGYRILFDAFDPNTPSPTRIGYHRLLTTVMRITDDRTVMAGARLSCAASILSLLLVAWLSWRFFGASAALAATMLFSVFPPELVIARRCWQEAVVELLSLAGIAIVCQVLAGSRSAVRYPLYMPLYTVVGVLAFTVKETSAVAFVFASAWLLLALSLRRDWRAVVRFSASACIAAVLSLAWMAQCLGGFSQLARLGVLSSRLTILSPYGLLYESGPGWHMLLGLWSLSIATTVLAFAGAAFAIWAAARRPRATPIEVTTRISLGLALFCVLFLGMAMVLPEKLNFRNVAVIFSPLAILAGAGFSRCLSFVSRVLPASEAGSIQLVLATVLTAAAIFDLHTFRGKFTAPDMLDLSIRMVLGAGSPEHQDLPAAATPMVDAGTAKTAADWVQVAANDVQAGRNEEAIAAARRALALEPGNAVAWNNIAAANENLQHWDEAIAAAQQAIKLQPDFQLAKNNLAWSISQKAAGK